MASKVFSTTEYVLPACHIREYPRATAHGQEDVLELCIKRYTPLEGNLRGRPPGPDAITIIGAHANGFPKELYEPLWVELYHRLEAAGQTVRGIWIADSVHQGQSGVINEAKLGNDPSWLDHSRDLLHMINHFRDEIPRPIVGIGHSMGAVQLTNLSLIHPRLFTSLVLIEPVIVPAPTAQTNLLPRLSLSRRDIWPSRQAAAEAFRRSKFYSTWDPRVLDLWVTHGLRECPSLAYRDESAPAVTLTTTRDQETASFTRYADHGPASGALVSGRGPPDLDPRLFAGRALYRPEPASLYRRLPELRPSALFVFGESTPVYIPPPPPSSSSGEATDSEFVDTRIELVRVTGSSIGGSGGVAHGMVKGVNIPRAAHLVPFEQVQLTAIECANWIGSRMDEFRTMEEDFRRESESVALEDRGKVCEGLKREVGLVTTGADGSGKKAPNGHGKGDGKDRGKSKL